MSFCAHSTEASTLVGIDGLQNADPQQIAV